MPTLIEQAESLAKEDFDSLPIIDLSDATSPSYGARHALAMKIQHAALTAGFFYIQNHGVDESIVAKTFEQSKAFFALPDEVKREVDISNSDNFRGYMAALTENTNPENFGDLHEAFNLGLDPTIAKELPGFQEAAESDGRAGLQHGENLWPREDSWSGAREFKETVLAFYREILELGKRIFPLLALALELPETFFDDKTRFPAAIQRLLYYPPLKGKPADERQPGIGEHTDYEVFTVLRQDDVGGLEVKNLSGQWIRAPCIPGTFVINIGDQLARWTNDIFRSTPHRAVPPPAFTPRYSIPTFWGCDHDVPLIPIPTCVSESKPSKYEVVTAGRYVQQRLAETYNVGSKQE